MPLQHLVRLISDAKVKRLQHLSAMMPKAFLFLISFEAQSDETGFN